MPAISGLLTIGTGVASGNVVLVPPSGTNYAPQPVTFEQVNGGVALNDVSCNFGPVSGAWGTLAAIGLTDYSGNAMFAGPMAQPWAPVNGELVSVPPGSVALLIGTQFSVAPITASVNTGITASGTTQATATLLSAQTNVVSTVAPSGAVLLPGVVEGSVSVLNRGANPLSVFPPLGGQIENYGTNIAATIAVSGNAEFVTSPGSGQWYFDPS